MTAHEALKKIPVQQEHVPGARVMHPARRTVQYLSLLIIILIPLSGLFRIDMEMGGVVMLDHQVWFSDITIVLGMWLFLASLLMLSYALVGSAFCGWMCPQNTASEFANMLTRKLLGRRADMMDLSGARMQVSVRRKSWWNYSLLAIGLMLPAAFYALIPLLYFNPPSVIWSFLSFSEQARQTGSLYWIYLILFALFLIDIAAVRHLLCKNFCFYRVWQQSFQSSESLRVAYDKHRSDDCTDCHFCVDACYLDIDPRQIKSFDGCVNCGECVTACDQLHHRSKKLQGRGLLYFVQGTGHDQDSPLITFFKRTKKPWLATLAGALLFAIGVASYQPDDFSVYHQSEGAAGQVLDYRINIAHKLLHPTTVRLSLEGLDVRDYRLDKELVHFDSAGRIDVQLHLSPSLGKGLHRFRVLARADDGWSAYFDVTHFSQGKVMEN
ncbi:MAG: 4Fe-4S binding protein [Mariprofundus sp.]|nr:4Fe-4S binding protein [Mariprofundus sp.]